MRSTMVFTVVGLIVIAGIGGGYLIWSAIRPGQGTTSTGQGTTSTASRTCTGIPAVSYMYCPSQLRISAEGTPGASPYGGNATQGSWNFTVSISSNSISAREPIILWANITNISGQNETFKEFVRPYINPTVSAENGTKVWAWNPPQSTWPSVTIADGETLSQAVIIPTSQLHSGQSYLIGVAPLFIQFPTPNNYAFTFTVSIH